MYFGLNEFCLFVVDIKLIDNFFNFLDIINLNLNSDNSISIFVGYNNDMVRYLFLKFHYLTVKESRYSLNFFYDAELIELSMNLDKIKKFIFFNKKNNVITFF